MRTSRRRSSRQPRPGGIPRKELPRRPGGPGRPAGGAPAGPCALGTSHQREVRSARPGASTAVADPGRSWVRFAAVARILLVEDDEDTCQLLALALRQRRPRGPGGGGRPAGPGRPPRGPLRPRRHRLRPAGGDRRPDAPGGRRRAAPEGRLGAGGDRAPRAGGSGRPQPAGQARRDRPLPPPGRAHPGPPPGPLAARPARPEPGPRGPAVEVTLYVGDNPASARARRIVESALGGRRPEQVHFRVVDAGKEPSAAEAARILFLPTLVVNCGAPAWILGDLSAPGALEDLLAMCGVAGP